MVIKAIETHYKGYRFRSRLEARWAMFFDGLGVQYEYEMEGYDLGKAGWYLPDFWLPQQRVIVEIKPPLLDNHGELEWPDTPKQEALIVALPEDGLYSRIVILCGAPGPVEDESWRCPKSYEGFVLDWYYTDSTKYVSGDNGYYWCECPKCGMVGMQYEGRANRLRCGCCKDKVRNMDTPRLRAAYIAARSARF